jgi:dTDP-4-amino-4,6-dideoxygalactose transaminase
MRDQSTKTYRGEVHASLGDGVYASFDGFQIVLTAENGAETTNRICLEPETIGALIRFARANGMIVGQDARRRIAPWG